MSLFKGRCWLSLQDVIFSLCVVYVSAYVHCVSAKCSCCLYNARVWTFTSALHQLHGTCSLSIYTMSVVLCKRINCLEKLQCKVRNWLTFCCIQIYTHFWISDLACTVQAILKSTNFLLYLAMETVRVTLIPWLVTDLHY